MTTSRTLARAIIAGAAGLAITCASAMAGDVIVDPDLASGDFSGDTVANARLRLDPTNWDSALGPDSNPGDDETDNISNTLADLNTTWSFSFQWDSTMEQITWMLTDEDGMLGTSTLTLDIPGAEFNTVEIFTTAQVDRDSFINFNSFGVSGISVWGDLPDLSLDDDIDMDQFEITRLVTPGGANLAEHDFEIFGEFEINKGTSTSQERPKFDIKLTSNDAIPVIPTPLAAGMAAVGLVGVGARRRRPLS